MADTEGEELSSFPNSDAQENGGTGHTSSSTNHLPTVEHDKHVKIYIEEDTYDPETEEFINKVYPDDSHIHDDHELAKPRTTPVSKLQ